MTSTSDLAAKSMAYKHIISWSVMRWGLTMHGTRNPPCSKIRRGVPLPLERGSQCLCGKSVSNPVREHSTLSRLVERRQRGAKGAREVASSGRGAGLAFGTMDVGIWEHTAASSGEYEESV